MSRTVVVTTIVSAVTALLIGLVIHNWDAINNKRYEWMTDPSAIVTGVPAQLETYDSNYVWTKHGGYTLYWLGYEQCAADVETAKRGEPKQSLNPEVGVMAPGCVMDWVRVDSATYSSAVIGSVVIFGSTVGEPLRK